MRSYGFFLPLILSLLFGIASSETRNSAEPSIPDPLDTGGPDAYGYSWIDNDSAGGPVYEWIDITGYGTRVLGLADDNNVGPFPIGFEFPYYWYTVYRMWIGSNGYLSFTSSANYAHPFSGLPDPGFPNDLIAILVGDLDFTQGNGECWMYSNHLDTLIISFLHVTEFGDPTASHTFQCILTAADSSIIFQYGPNQGNFFSSGPETVIGMENATGQIGLEYLEDNNPPARMWHEGLAIKFHPEPDPGLVIHDVNIKFGLNGSSGGEFFVINDPYYVRVYLENNGNQQEDFSLRCQIRRGFTTVYDETEYINDMDPGEEFWLQYQQPFITNIMGTYRVTFTLALSGDMNPYNNSRTVELDCYQLPQYMSYCDDIPERGRMGETDSVGFAVDFQIPEPVEISSAGFYVSHLYSNSTAAVKILPADSTGNPVDSQPLAYVITDVTSTGWKDIDLSQFELLFNRNREFFVAVVTYDVSGFQFGMDQTLPLSNRGWVYDAEIIPDYSRIEMDIMFRVFASLWPGGGCPYVPGDVNNDSHANGLDVIFMVNYFKGISTPVDTCECLGYDYIETGDVNNSCSFNALDITHMVNFFKGFALLLPCQDCLPPEY